MDAGGKYMENIKSIRQVRLWQIYQNSYLSYFLMYNFYYLSWALFSALISVYLMNMGFRASDVSFVVSASFLTSLLTQPMIGKWNDQYDMKIVNTILFVIAIIGAILFMLSHHLIMIMLSYSIVLMMINGVNPIMEKIATASPYQYGKIRIWGTIGYALGSGMAGFLYEHIAPEAIFIVFIFTMSLCILGLLGTKPKQVEKKAENKVPVKTREILKNKKFLYYLMICGLFYGVTYMSNTFIPSMLTDKGLDVGTASSILSLAVFCEAPLVLFSAHFMDCFSNKVLLSIATAMVCFQCIVYGLNLPMWLTVIVTLLVKHPAGMLFIMINLKVVNTLIDEKHQITALAIVATLKNLVSILFQNAAGQILDMTSYSFLYMICFGCMVISLLLVIFFKIDKGTDQKLFS